MKAARILLVLPAALSLCQCAVNDDRVSSLLVSPAGEQYDFYSCAQLIAQMKGIKTAQKELKLHMTNAGTVGSVVGGYKLDYANQHGNFVAARNAARDKKCEIPADVVVDEPL
jgi:hypothetical protein